MLSIKEFAKLKKVSRQRIHQLMREQRISPPPVRVGNYYAIEPWARIKPLDGKR